MWNEFEHVEDDRFDPNRDGYYGEYRDHHYGYEEDDYDDYSKENQVHKQGIRIELLLDVILWTIVKPVDTISQKKLSGRDIKSDSRKVLLFDWVLTFQEHHEVFWSYRSLQCIQKQITEVLVMSDRFYDWFLPF